MNTEELPERVIREGIRLYEEGVLHEDNREDRKAIESYRKSMETTFPDATIMNRIAFCYMRLNEPRRALQNLYAALELEPTHYEVLHNLTLLLTDTGRLEEAEDMAQRGIATNNMLEKHYHNLGKVKHLKGEMSEAEKCLTTAVKLAPENADAHRCLAITCHMLGANERAEREFLQTVRLVPDNGEALRDYGFFLMALGKYREAEKVLREAVSADPINPEVVTALAEVILEQVLELKEEASDEMFEEVPTLLNKSLSLDVEYGRTWFVWARVCMTQHEWEEAERFLRTAVNNGCTDPWAWAHLSYILSQLGRESEATEMFNEYRRAVEREEQNRERGIT